MFKKFGEWIVKKSFLHNKIKTPNIKEGMVFWCSVGENIGDEENGKGDDFRRPVLILKKYNKVLFWGIPMTTKNKENKYYVKILLKDKVQSVMISQHRTFDSKRLAQFIGYIKKEDLVKVKKEIIKLLT